MRVRRKRINKIIERGNRVLIIQGTFSLKLIEIPESFYVPCHVSDIVAVIEKEIPSTKAGVST